MNRSDKTSMTSMALSLRLVRLARHSGEALSAIETIIPSMPENRLKRLRDPARVAKLMIDIASRAEPTRGSYGWLRPTRPDRIKRSGFSLRGAARDACYGSRSEQAALGNERLVDVLETCEAASVGGLTLTPGDYWPSTA